jgi:hypothetical protein
MNNRFPAHGNRVQNMNFRPAVACGGNGGEVAC